MDRFPNASSINIADRPQFKHRCRYCAKRFPSTQALGGHQNAHKVQRSMEKAMQKFRDNKHLDPFERSRDLVDLIRVGYNAGPRLRLGRAPYGIGRNGSYDVYSRWGTRNIIPQYPAQNHDLNLRLSSCGATSLGSGPSSVPVYPNLSVFGGDQQDEDDSGLDLSLKL